MKRITVLVMLFILSLALAGTVGASILFYDDFEDGNDDGWTRIKRVNAWTVIEGKYYLTGDGYGPGEPPGRDGFSYTHIDDSGWADYVYDVTFDTTNAGGYPPHVHQVILKFRVQEPLVTEYRLDIWVPGDPSSATSLGRCVNGACTTLATVGPAAVLGTNTARILLEGGHIQVDVNGVKVIDVNDPSPIPYGGIGVGAIWEVEAWFDDIRVTAVCIPAAVDVAPDTLNLKGRNKWVSAYIELAEGYDVADIDVGTVRLEGTIPAESHPTQVGDYDGDGVPDLVVKFDRQALIEYLDGMTGEVTLTVSGQLTDGPPFEGSDTIRIIDKGKGEGEELQDQQRPKRPKRPRRRK